MSFISFEKEKGSMSNLAFIDTYSQVEQGQCQSQVQPAPITEYAEFEFEDFTHHEPLLSNESDQESILDDGIEHKQYKLPSEGGTIFSSFVRVSVKYSFFFLLNFLFRYIA